MCIALGRSGEENVPLLVDGFPAGTMVNEVGCLLYSTWNGEFMYIYSVGGGW